MNIIFEKVPFSNNKKKSLNLIVDNTTVTWIQLFRFLSNKTGLDYRHFSIQYHNKRYTGENLWSLRPFKLCNSKEDFILFKVSVHPIKN